MITLQVRMQSRREDRAPRLAVNHTAASHRSSHNCLVGRLKLDHRLHSVFSLQLFSAGMDVYKQIKCSSGKRQIEPRGVIQLVIRHLAALLQPLGTLALSQTLNHMPSELPA